MKIMYDDIYCFLIWILLIDEFPKHINSGQRLRFYKEGLNIFTLHQ
jgi:hypothetical protein